MGRMLTLGVGGGGGGGGGGATPPISGFAYYFDAERDTYTDTLLTTPTTADGNNVQSWKDQSPNLRHIAKPALAGIPTIQYAEVNGKKCVRFGTGGTDALTLAFTLAQPVTIFGVCRLNTWNATKGYIWDGVGSDTMDLLCVASSPTVAMFAGSAVACNNSNLAVGTWGIWCGVYNGASSRLRVNAGTATTGNPGGVTTGGLTLGHNGASFAGTTGANVDFATVLAYPSALDTTDEQTVRDWLNGIYAIF